MFVTSINSKVDLFNSLRNDCAFIYKGSRKWEDCKELKDEEQTWMKLEQLSSANATFLSCHSKEKRKRKTTLQTSCLNELCSANMCESDCIKYCQGARIGDMLSDEVKVKQTHKINAALIYSFSTSEKIYCSHPSLEFGNGL